MRDGRQRLVLLHLVNLRSVGGIQKDFSRFIAEECDWISVEHHTLLTRPGLSPSLEYEVRDASASIQEIDKWGAIRIPRWARLIFRLHLKGLVERVNPDALILWSNPRALRGFRPSGSVRIIYYEHGASWFDRDHDGILSEFKRFDGILCNSYASSRMVELKWCLSDASRIKICPNGIVLRSDRSGLAERQLKNDAPVIIGIAGRMEPIKGFPMAIHAVHELVNRGVNIKLKVAGVGPDLPILKGLAVSLGIAEQIEFLGFVEDMSAYYGKIDVLLCPSIRESFGLVCGEAMANGIPVICSSVDGLPEVVEDHKSGFCLQPELAVAQYPQWGGRLEGIPRQVYDPESDQILPPRLISPSAIADCVQRLLETPGLYESMSQYAMARAQGKFDYLNHVRQVLSAIDEICP